MLVNLTPAGREHFRLPADRAARSPSSAAAPSTLEAAVHPDTLLLDPENRRLSLVWRVSSRIHRTILDFNEAWVGPPTEPMLRARREGRTYIRAANAALPSRTRTHDPRARHRLDRHGDRRRPRRPLRLRRDARPARRLPGDPLPRPRRRLAGRRPGAAAAQLASARSASPTWPPPPSSRPSTPYPDARGTAALILCLAEEDRPGRLAPDAPRLAARIAEITGLTSPHRTRIVAHGRPSGHVALDQARRLLADRHLPLRDDLRRRQLPDDACTIAHYLAERRLLTPDNPNGFIPGEAAAAILCARPGSGGRCASSASASPASPPTSTTPADLPLRADGMTAAYRGGLAEAGLEIRADRLPHLAT